MKKHIVKLSGEEKAEIKEILQRGKQLASVRNRAQMLLLSDSGGRDRDIAAVVQGTVRTVCNVRRRYCEEGLEITLYGKPRPGRPKDFDSTDETELISLACSDPPTGNVRWTLELLREKMTKPIGKSTVHLMLKKTNINLGSKRCGASGK